jgi:succinoglycan biosynthesis transport protein ExoP
MLQATKTPPLEGELTPPTEVLETLTGLIRRQYPWLVGCVTLGLLLGLLYILITPKSYTGQTLVMVDPLRMQMSGGQNAPVDSTAMSINVDSQIPVIKSHDIAVPVIKALHLESRLEFADSGLSAWLFQVPATGNEHSAEISQTLVDAFERQLDVQRLGLTFVIRIDFRSSSPQIAAEVSNLIAETYIQQQQDARSQALHRASAWLQNSIKELAQQASDAEQVFIDFKTRSDLSNQSQATFHELESRARTYRTLHENFLQRYGESVQQQSFPVADSRIVSRAVPPERKSAPQGRLVMAIGLFAGLLSGLAIAIWRDLSDHTFRTAGQVEAALQTRFMSYVPALNLRRSWLAWTTSLLRGQGSADHAPKRWRIVRSRSRRRSTRLAALCMASIDFPVSRFTEAIRVIKLRLELSSSSRKCQIIGITSALPGEGKSAIAVNLARLLAGSGLRTILVDCDLHNPELSRTFGAPHRGGLLSGLENARSLEEVIWTDAETGLKFLPAGVASRFAQPHGALASDAMCSIFEALRDSYEIVIVDLSALLPLIDVCLTARFVDTYVLVIEWGRTAADVVTHALETVGIRDKLVGVVLNKTETDQIRRFQGSRAIIDQSRLYARYGYTD